MSDPGDARQLDRYLLFAEFASGGMASVHFGRLRGPVGFSRTVAIKKLLPQYARDPEFVAMFIDEARLAARVRHPNVATVADVVASEDELFLVMDYVHGESAAELQRASRRAGSPMPPRIAAGILLGALHGLHAAHGATSETGVPLGIVHRDVSPENIMVGVDGISRVLDFGIAFAVGRAQVTREGHLKGKLKYTAPELLEGREATPLVDVYSAGVVLWELMVGRRLFTGDNEAKILLDILRGEAPPPSSLVPGLPPSLDAIVKRATARQRESRYPSADDFARDVEERLDPASPREIGAWVQKVARAQLAGRAELLASIEGSGAAPTRSATPPPAAPVLEEDVLTDVDAVNPALEDETETTIEAQRPSAQKPEAARQALPTAPSLHRPSRAPTNWPLILAACALVATASSLLVISLRTTASLPTSHSPIFSGPIASSAPPRDANRDVDPAPIASPATPAPVVAPSPPSPVDTSRARPPDRSKSSARACDPPYTVDARGMHHFKPSCM